MAIWAVSLAVPAPARYALWAVALALDLSLPPLSTRLIRRVPADARRTRRRAVVLAAVPAVVLVALLVVERMAYPSRAGW